MEQNKLKVVIISHAQVIPVFQNRWKRLAQDDIYEVHLLVPEYWEQTWFGEKVIYKPTEVHANNFHVHPLPTTSVKNWSRYLFKSIDAKFKEIQPQLIYIVHEEGILIHQQIYLYRKLFAPEAKIIFFSMNARGVPYQITRNPLKKIVYKWMWNTVVNQTEASLVHYPGCLESLRKGGYDKPVFLQTQVGVDENVFFPDSYNREKYRKKIKFQDKFVIGYSGRLTKDKGVDDLVAVFLSLVRQHENLALLLVGNGELRNEVESKFFEAKLNHLIHITGFVDQAEVPAYMNAMDVFVLGSKTTPHWVDTFPLVTVQAQAIGLAVIASNSGAIPWQLADSASIFPEGDKEKLKEAILNLIQDKGLRNKIALGGRKRCLENFSHAGMTENFKKIIQQVMSGAFNQHSEGETYTQWKAY